MGNGRGARARRTVVRVLVGLGVVAGVAAGIAPAADAAVGGAAFTTVNEAVDGTGHCLNSPINCNIYDHKKHVWLNGGPQANGLKPGGEYFFAVLAPGGQPTPNDGGAKNLSDDYDTYQNRTFTVAGEGQVDEGEVVAYSGTHDADLPLIRLMPYADTPNPGGVYILAICSLEGGYPVAPSDCKYDAFKVKRQVADPVITKTATPYFERDYNWTLSKTGDRGAAGTTYTPGTAVNQASGNVTVNYDVLATRTGPVDSAWKVTGEIEIRNFNDFSIPGTLTDAIVAEPNATCTIEGAASPIPVTLAPGDTTFAYQCVYSTAPAGSSQDNRAALSWPRTGRLQAGSTTAVANFTWGAPDVVRGDCATLSDTAPEFGSDRTICATTTVQYSRSLATPAPGTCADYPNTATLVPNGGSSLTSSWFVRVCVPAPPEARTMGFWQNPNGQRMITESGPASGTCALTTWLRGYAPFKDLSDSAGCTDVAAWVYDRIHEANAGGESMNPMLKAQMLATALSVYFTDPALGGNQLGGAPLAGFVVDLTNVKGANCSGSFGGATSLSVGALLTYAAAQSNDGGSWWYDNVKAVQGCAKDTFDAINNKQATSP